MKKNIKSTLYSELYRSQPTWTCCHNSFLSSWCIDWLYPKSVMPEWVLLNRYEPAWGSSSRKPPRIRGLSQALPLCPSTSLSSSVDHVARSCPFPLQTVVKESQGITLLKTAAPGPEPGTVDVQRMLLMVNRTQSVTSFRLAGDCVGVRD